MDLVAELVLLGQDHQVVGFVFFMFLEQGEVLGYVSAEEAVCSYQRHVLELHAH
jgi:hypothetical protein